MENIKTEIQCLKVNINQQAHRIRMLEKWVDTVATPVYKRVWFVMKGYYWNRLGVWYHASWNKDAWHYDD